MTASTITNISSATSSSIVVKGITIKGTKADFDNCISKISCGMISGNPSTAMIAAFCCALAAIAAKKLKTRLRLHPPSNTNPIKGSVFSNGLPRNNVNNNKLSILISSMSSELNSSFDITK